LQSGFLKWFPFDPLNLNSPANEVKEIKNGRLAMVSRSHRHFLTFLSELKRNSASTGLNGMLGKSCGRANVQTPWRVVLVYFEFGLAQATGHRPPVALGCLLVDATTSL